MSSVPTDSIDVNPTTSKLASYKSGLLALVPTILIIGLLLVVPASFALVMSIYDKGWTLTGFPDVLRDKIFRKSLQTTILYSFLTVSLQLILGTFTATIVHRSHKVGRSLAWIFFIPYAVPSVVAVVAWKFLVLDQGMLPKILERLLRIPAQVWIGDWVFATLVFVSVWQFYPFVFLSLLARMRRIPPVLYRNAHLDGANHLQEFLFVTVPSIKGTLLTIAILRLAFMFTKFDTPWLLVGGTANDAVETLPIYIYQKMGMEVHLQAICAAVVMAIILLSLIAVLSIVHRLLRAEEI
jgi:multiple sugar transport system permease protein